MRTIACLSLTAAVALALAVGCQPAADSELAPATDKTLTSVDDHDHPDGVAHEHADGEEHGGHTHGAWWCNEHGVPEEVCALCNSKLAADFQRDGDWCEDHDRPDSQCFVCHPDLEARFAAQYEAKYGEKPPKPAG